MRPTDGAPGEYQSEATEARPSPKLREVPAGPWTLGCNVALLPLLTARWGVGHGHCDGTPSGGVDRRWSPSLPIWAH